ncbi:MAG: hypothetical protein GW938_08525 [Leptospira sp.]|nr:hypothetical protein [Leptospira sp.]
MPNVVDFQISLNLIPKEEIDNLKFISKTLKESGEECFLVGGSVRDLVLGKVPHEYDLTTSALPETIKSKFKRVFDTGILHGTVTIVIEKSSYEITTYRSEQGFTDGRRPDSVKFGVSLDEDLERRDFTINSLAYNIITQELIDNHNGIADIQNKIIRTIGKPLERFTEDGLRPIRGIRFASTLGFTINQETESAFTETHSITRKVAVERFVQELQKIILSSSPNIGLQKLLSYNYFQLFTSIEPTMNPKWNLEYLFQMIPSENLGLKWAVLKEICFGEIAMSPQKNIFRDFKLSSTIEREALLFSGLFPYLFSSSEKLDTKIELKSKLLAPIKQFYQASNPKYLDSVWRFILTYFQAIKSESHMQIDQILKNEEALVLSDLAINGEWVNNNFPDAKGKKIGEILRIILEFIWENPKKNSEKEILVHLNSTDKMFN